jgi:hypothetical protein
MHHHVTNLLPPAAELRQLPGTTALPARRVLKGGSAMSEVIPFPPKPPPKSIEEETREFLELLERIRSQSQKSK